MKLIKPTVAMSLTAILVSVVLSSGAEAERRRPIVLGQTEGFADGKLAVFDYGQNFICANAPLNNAECLVGTGFTSLRLPGLRLDSAAIPDLIVIVPFFQNLATAEPDCPAAAVACLEAFDPTPDVFVQCPETQSSSLAGGTAFGQFGHCILHDTTLSLAPLAGVTVLTNVGPITLGGSIPLPNHTHIVAATPGNSEQAWDTFVVLVLDPALWPDQDGNCAAGSGCLTSFDAVLSAPSGSVVGPVPTTLVLFFGVHGLEP